MNARRRPESYQKALALTIRQLRKERGYSQEDLALNAGINRSHMSRIERSHTNPQFETLIKLCNLFDISFADFAAHVEANLGRRRRNPAS